MADDNTVTTDGIAGGRMLWNPTTTIHVGDSTAGDVQGGDGIELFDPGSGTDTAGAGRNFNIILGCSGADVFFFSEGHGADTIQDFNAAEGDEIYLRSFDQTITTVTDPNDPNTVTGVQIDLSDWGSGTIILNGITDVNDVTADMFYLDTIVGGDGDDDLRGGTSDDDMTGGGGAERNAGAVVSVRRSGGAGVARRGRVGLGRGGVAVGLVQKLDASAGDEQNLGREPVAVLAGLRPAPGLQLAVDVDQPALGGVLLEHVDQPVLEGHDPMPLGLVDLVAGLPVQCSQMQSVTPKRVIFRM